jgi:SAM-dependent methyltransferase
MTATDPRGIFPAVRGLANALRGTIQREQDQPRTMHDELIRRYERTVASIIKYKPDEAMELAVGGGFEQMGKLIADTLERVGLRDGSSVIDLGCGSGRLASELGRRFPNLTYLGTDILQPLLDHAVKLSPPHFRFVLHKDISIPAPDASADFCIAFSVFTHLLHEHSFLYLEDAVRVVRPGGTIVFSFLESENHWGQFEQSLKEQKLPDWPLTMFIERPMIESWAKHLNLKVKGYEPVGQTAVLLQR